MKGKKTVLPIFLIGTLAALSLLGIEQAWRERERFLPPDVFVGVEIAYDGVQDCKKLVDKVRDYTNLFVIGSTEITTNVTRLDEVCQYIYNAGLYFIVFMIPTEEYNQIQWVAEASQRWGYRFLGTYVFDEVGGKQIDRNPGWVKEADNYTDAANKFVELLNVHLTWLSHDKLKSFTSEYALYWFDYKSGYDVVLCHFAWNHSRPLHVALCRGAAAVHGKEWGVMITWTYRHRPYMVSGDELYEDMVLAYSNGAKYIVVFNYPKEGPYGILTEEHFNALKEFWRYVKSNPQRPGATKRKLAYVLPKDYGWGFRGLWDKIWLWESDELSEKIWNDVNHLLNAHDPCMDIIYDDPKCWEDAQLLYEQFIFWNQTELQ